MSKSQNSFMKKQRAIKKSKKKREKFEQKLERSRLKKEEKEIGLDAQEDSVPMGYVDEYGNVVTIKPEDR